MNTYSVSIRPLIKNNLYGEAIDVTHYVSKNPGISSIKATVDSTDFVVGTFSYTNLKLGFLNYDRLLSVSGDTLSIFPMGRDKALVEIKFKSLSFIGLINEESSREDEDKLDIVITSRESILNKNVIVPNLIQSGMKFSEALYSIMNNETIGILLSIDRANINLDFDGVINDGEFFDGINMSEGINAILTLSNSYLYIDDDGVVFVESRFHKKDVEANFFGPYDKQGRSPVVLRIKKYNDGRHRAFNTFIVGDRRKSDFDSIRKYSYREKSFDAKFINDDEQKDRIALNLVEKYKTPKIEFEITVPTSEIPKLGVGSVVTVFYPRLIKAGDGRRIPKYGKNVYLFSSKYPSVKGNIKISDDIRFVVYGREDIPKSFITILKLREYGYKINDSKIIPTVVDDGDRYGTALYGEGSYG